MNPRFGTTPTILGALNFLLIFNKNIKIKRIESKKIKQIPKFQVWTSGSEQPARSWRRWQSGDRSLRLKSSESTFDKKSPLSFCENASIVVYGGSTEGSKGVYLRDRAINIPVNIAKYKIVLIHSFKHRNKMTKCKLNYLIYSWRKWALISFE